MRVKRDVNRNYVLELVRGGLHTISELCNHTGLTKQMISVYLKRLEAKNLVYRVKGSRHIEFYENNGEPQKELPVFHLEVLRHIHFIQRRYGCTPSMQEIQRKLGVTTLRTVYDAIELLQSKGYLRRARYSRRAIVLTEAGIALVSEANS